MPRHGEQSQVLTAWSPLGSFERAVQAQTASLKVRGYSFAELDLQVAMFSLSFAPKCLQNSAAWSVREQKRAGDSAFLRSSLG